MSTLREASQHRERYTGAYRGNTMQAALRPMNLGEILDRTFEIYRKRFLLFVGIAALPAAVMLALHLADIAWVHTDRWIRAAGQDQMDRIALSFVLGYGFYHISGLVRLLFQPAFVRVSSRELFGEDDSIVDSLRFVAARFRTYLWISFLVFLSALILPEAITFGVFFLTGTIEDKLGLIGDSPNAAAMVVLVLEIFAGVILMIWAKLSLSLTVPAVALEQLRGLKSLRRSWQLTRDSRWRILIAWMMVVICGLVLEGVTALLAWWIATLIYTAHHAAYNEQTYRIVVYFFYSLIAVVIGPLYPIALTLLYYDQRSRKEGYDIERMMEAAGLLAPAVVQAAPATEVSATHTSNA